MAKYHNKKTEHEGYTFDSKAEAARYRVLRLMQDAGEISDLELQPRFELLPAFIDASGTKHRAITYRADFAYIEDGRRVVEDTKGYQTKEYLIKRKLLLHSHRDIVFREVKA